MDDPLNPLPNEVSNEELVGRIHSGDRAAETELFQRFSTAVMYLVAHSAPDRAEDILQETFRLVLERLRGRGIAEPEKIDRFLVRTARNLLASSSRNLSRFNSINNAELISLAPDERPGPLQQISRERSAASVRQVIQEMRKERDRLILYRFYVLGENKEQICAQLELYPRHFNRVLYRAKQRFKELVLDRNSDDMEFDTE